MVLTFGEVLDGFVVVHDAEVDSVQQHEEEGFVPLHVLIVHDADEDGHGDAVREAVARQRPPVQRNHLE